MNVLFVCSMGLMRSPTAAHVYGCGSRYAGVDSDAHVKLTVEMIDWADKIICFEWSHKSKIRKMKRGISDKVFNWKIPDEFAYMDDQLVVRLRGLMEEWLYE